MTFGAQALGRVAAGGGPARVVRRQQIEPWLYRLGSLAVLLALWEWMGRTRGSAITFPPVSSVVLALAGLVQTAVFWQAFWTTLQTLIVGFGAAIAAGVPLGLLIGRSAPVRKLTSLYLRLLLSTPISPLVPLVVIVFGIGLTARAAIVFAYTLPIIAINTAAGVLSINPRLIEMARSFEAGEAQIFRRIVFPGSVPAIMAGLRLGTARAVVGMVVSELILISVGLGRLITRFSATYRSADIFAVTIVLMVIGVAAIGIVKLIEERLVRWKPAA